MATIVIIRDEGGIAGIEVRDQGIVSKGYTIIKAVGDARTIWRGQDIPLRSRNLKLQDRRDAADEILASDRFTPEQKEEFYSLLSGRSLHLDTFSSEYQPGYYARTHPVTDVPGPPTYPPITRVIDP